LDALDVSDKLVFDYMADGLIVFSFLFSIFLLIISDHQTIKPSNHQTIKPSNHQTIKPSNHRFRLS